MQGGVSPDSDFELRVNANCGADSGTRPLRRPRIVGA